MRPEGPIRLDMNNPKFQEQLLTRPGDQVGEDLRPITPAPADRISLVLLTEQGGH